MTTVAKQPWLRPAPTQPASLESVRNVDEMTVLPDGERLYVATQRGDVDDGDTYDLVLLDRSFNVLERQTDLPTATPGDCPHMLVTQHGFYEWVDQECSPDYDAFEVDGSIRRFGLNENGTVDVGQELAENLLPYRVEDVVAAADGTLFVRATEAGGEEGFFADNHPEIEGRDDHFVAVHDPLTLHERLRFGSDHLSAGTAGLPICVVGTELYVSDCVRGDQPYVRFQVFSLTGEYLRVVRVNAMDVNMTLGSLTFVNEHLYAVVEPRGRRPRIIVLTPQGTKVQSYRHASFQPGSAVPFAGGLAIAAAKPRLSDAARARAGERVLAAISRLPIANYVGVLLLDGLYA